MRTPRLLMRACCYLCSSSDATIAAKCWNPRALLWRAPPGRSVFQLRIGGRWERQQAVQVDQNGNATVSAGVALPADLRFKHTGQRSGVKNGVSNTVTVRLAQ